MMDDKTLKALVAGAKKYMAELEKSLPKLEKEVEQSKGIKRKYAEKRLENVRYLVNVQLPQKIAKAEKAEKAQKGK